MSATPQFEELDFRETPLGDLILRRRTVLALDNLEVFEIILGDAFLMSSMFTVVEEELSRRGLAAVDEGFSSLDVVVGGLGLGYTAAVALEHPQVKVLKVVDFLEPVIEWHRSELVPLGKTLNADARCEYVQGDFFELATTAFDDLNPEQKYHAVLLDIDHSPEKLLHDRHANLYTQTGLTKLARQIHPGGVFALWSDDPPEQRFVDNLEQVFQTVDSHIVKFSSPLNDRELASTIYVAKKQ